jgi:hypothetical protein
VQALCAAGNTGLEVDKARVARAAGFVMSCYRADSGGFAYQPGGDATTSMTGAGVLSLMLLNRGPSDISSPGTGTAATTGWRYMVENPVGDGTDMPYYAMYYSTAAAYQAGGSAMLTAGGSAMLTTGGSTALTAGGSTWPAVWSKTSARLMSMRDKDGGWQVSPSGQEPGRVYATAMAVLTMSMPYRVLPMYQR